MEETNIIPQPNGEIGHTDETVKAAATSVVRTVKMGMDLSRLGVTIQGQPFFEGKFESFLDLSNGEPVHHPQAGIIHRGLIFTSLRDSWDKLDHIPWNMDKEHQFQGLPNVSGRIDEASGERIVWITGNSVGGTDFNGQVLKGKRGSILLYSTGKFRYQYGGEDRILTDLELEELKKIFDDGYQKLDERKVRWEKQNP